MNPFTNTLKSLISTNKIKLVLEILMDYLKERDTDLYNQCLMHHSVLLQAEKEYAMGIINRSEASQVLAKVRYGVINITDELSQKPVDDKVACERANEIQQIFKEAEFSVQTVKTNQKWLFISGGMGLAAVIVVLVFYLFNDKNGTPLSKPAAIRVDTAVLLVSLEKILTNIPSKRTTRKHWSL